MACTSRKPAARPEGRRERQDAQSVHSVLGAARPPARCSERPSRGGWPHPRHRDHQNRQVQGASPAQRPEGSGGHRKVIEFTPVEVAEYYRVRLSKLNQRGAEWRCPCPIHKGTRDSFAVDPESGRWNCHSTCGRGGDILALEQELFTPDFKAAKAEAFRIVGRPESPNGSSANGRRGSARGRIAATYDYTDEDGRLLYQAVRMDPKDLRQRQPDGKGGWVWNIKGVRLVLYPLPGLLKRVNETVFICEGEKAFTPSKLWGCWLPATHWAPASGVRNTPNCSGDAPW